jgi:hypothetical protein
MTKKVAVKVWRLKSTDLSKDPTLLYFAIIAIKGKVQLVSANRFWQFDRKFIFDLCKFL